jgi:hypothetical protein
MQIKKPIVLTVTFLMIAAMIIPAALAATLTTDKLTYYIGEDQTATLTGSDYEQGAVVTLQFTIAEDSSYSFSDTVTADDLGGFTYVYALPGIVGTYTATALDVAGNVLATTTFEDPTREYSATISPTAASAGSTDTYTVTITAGGSNTQGFGSATITIPTSPDGGFTSVSLSVSPNPVASPNTKTWDAAIYSGLIQLQAHTGTDKLVAGESVSVSFDATAPSPASSTDYTWVTHVYQDVNTVGAAFTLTSTPFANTDDDPVVTVSPASVTTVDITITSDPTGSGFVKVDDVAITTPQTFSWTPDDEHTLEALSPVMKDGYQYFFVDWSDGGSQTHTYTVPSSDETVTAEYVTPQELDFEAVNKAGPDYQVSYTISANVDLTSVKVQGGLGQKAYHITVYVDTTIVWNDISLEKLGPVIVPGGTLKLDTSNKQNVFTYSLDSLDEGDSHTITITFQWNTKNPPHGQSITGPWSAVCTSDFGTLKTPYTDVLVAD